MSPSRSGPLSQETPGRWNTPVLTSYDSVLGKGYGERPGREGQRWHTQALQTATRSTMLPVAGLGPDPPPLKLCKLLDSVSPMVHTGHDRL